MFSISFISLSCEQPGIVPVGSTAITFRKDGGNGSRIDFHKQYNGDLKTSPSPLSIKTHLVVCVYFFKTKLA